MTLETELNDRTLRFDGVSVLSADEINQFLLRGIPPSKIRVKELTPELELFNQHVVPEEQIMVVSEEPITFDLTWILPAKYVSLDIEQHVLEVFSARLPELGYDSAQTEFAIARVARELNEYHERGLDDLLRVVVYVLDRFRETNQVWGVGRGSSCASFILFLIGLHVVDTIKYNVPLEEFFHD